MDVSMVISHFVEHEHKYTMEHAEINHCNSRTPLPPLAVTMVFKNSYISLILVFAQLKEIK
jgi:hypothetical protein